MEHARRVRRWFAVLVLVFLASSFAMASGPGVWSATGSMAVPRTQHTAARLADGRVLAVGGITAGGGTTASAEIYDPGSGTWSPTAGMATPRSRHTQTVLHDGRVLVTGGRFQGFSLGGVEMYDPSTGLWAPAPDMHVVRDNHSATLLADGRVLVAGGVSSGDGGGPAEKTAEIYDPASGSWTLADHMFLPRYNHEATLLADGRVLVTGGFNISAFHIPAKSVELYDPIADRWRQVADMRTPRATHIAAQLNDGRVLVAGGWTQPPNAITLTADAESYDAATNTWTPVPGLPERRGSLINQVVMLADGDVLVAGGRLDSGTTNTSVRYDALTQLWAGTGTMSAARSGATAVLLADGRVLIAGGGNPARIL
jgi:N-acetylneuraminic acid mutarotase